MDVIDICNLAISLVGGTSIISLVDASVEAEECDRFYDVARQYCLENRAWTFASATRELAADNPAVSTEFSYSYAVPSNCLVLREVSSSSDLLTPITYQKTGNSIVTDSAAVHIKYTKDITVTSLFSPSFQIALAHKLGELIAPKITGSSTIKRTLLEESEGFIENGGSIDGMQGSPKRAFASRLLHARFSGTTRYGLGNKL